MDKPRFTCETGRKNATGFKGDLKPHEVRELINDLTDIAREYHGHQCLRALMSNRVLESLKK